MEKKLYLLVTRNNIGAWEDKVKVLADLDFCKQALRAMCAASTKAIRGEIIEGGKDYYGDSRVKPLHKFEMREDQLVEVSDENN